MSREVMNKAIEALEDEIVLYREEGGAVPFMLINAVNALRAELAKPEPDTHVHYIGWQRYEKLRKLTPRAFTELWQRNLNGDVRFDDLVDALE